MRTEFYLGDNLDYIDFFEETGYRFDVIYGDCIYESEDFEWAKRCKDILTEDGIFYVQTDYHTVANYKLLLDDVYGRENFINWLIYIQEWGGVPRRAFPRKHDDILMYANSDNYKFYRERIQIPKITANSNFNVSGRATKTPCDVFYDLGNFSTVSKERVKHNGKGFQWQKPLKLIDRLFLPVTDEGDWVFDPFGGVATVGVWCKENNRNYIGVENDESIFKLGKERLSGQDT